VITLLVDANLDGHAELLEMRLAAAAWRELRDYLELRFLYFEQAGLDRAATDDVVWRFCQAQRLYLITANRNRDSDDSLEATIQREGTSNSLPVFTLADAGRIFQSAAYLDRVVEKLLDYLLYPETYRGAGGLFLP
jgi:hypothetical protein